MKANYQIRTESNDRIPFGIIRFPTGEVAVKITNPEGICHDVQKKVTIAVQGYEPDTLFIIANMKDALQEIFLQQGKSIKFQLFIGYMPNARYDRHMVDGDGFALRVYCEMINLLKFDTVLVVDPHSDQTSALIKNCVTVKQNSVMLGMLRELDIHEGIDFLVAPDAGSYKKIFGLATAINKPVVIMNKVRNLETGNITHTELITGIPDTGKGRCLIVDDICDGGRTFIEAAKVLRESGATRVDLAVTHGIFSAGLHTLLDNGIDHIYTTDTVQTLDFDWDGRVKQVEFFKV